MKMKQIMLEIASGIKEIESNVFSLFNLPDKITYFVDSKACEEFLNNYPKVKEAMFKLAGKGKVLSNYRKFIAYKQKNESDWGGTFVPNKSDKIFTNKDGNMKFIWPEKSTRRGGDLGWAEVFQYVTLKKNGII